VEKFEFEVTPEASGTRLDVFLVDNLKHGYSRTLIRKYIDDGRVLVNGQPAKASHEVVCDEVITIDMPPPDDMKLEPENIPLDIVFEDKDLIVVNKQAGLVVHPAPGNYTGTLVNALLYHCKDLSGIGGVMRPGIVHRLDKDTSGLIVAAKNDVSHRELSEQFKDKKASRVYVALVKGVMEFDNDMINLPIGRHHMHREKMDVDFSGGRDASTVYHVLGRYKDFTVCELVLGTGRTHQIRVHLAHIGYPVLGDRTYGYSNGIARQALHAKRLSFVHPATKKRVEFDTELPDDMREVIERGHI
jgi:23S rRNA pseudouridine1911/1915/1917 synthase